MSMQLNKKWAVVIALSLACVALAVFLLYPRQAKPEFEHEGWINCMPVLSKEQSELCYRAEEAGYPYIAY